METGLVSLFDEVYAKSSSNKVSLHPYHPIVAYDIGFYL